MNELIDNLSIFTGVLRQNKMKPENDAWQKILDNIKAELKLQNITYEKFAELFGRKQGWFSHIMTKRTISLLYEIAEKLGVSPASLLPGENPIEKPDFEEYVTSIIDEHLRKILQEEIEKALKKK